MLPGNGGVVSHNCTGILVEKNSVSAGEDEQVAIRHQMHIRIQIVSTLDQESQGRQVSVASSKMRLSPSVLVPVVDAAIFLLIGVLFVLRAQFLVLSHSLEKLVQWITPLLKGL